MIYEETNERMIQEAINMKDLIPERQKLFYNEVELALDHHSLDHYNIRSLGGVIYLDDKGF